jgi:RNA polymerase sigma-70 factor (ECF subfamily)
MTAAGEVILIVANERSEAEVDLAALVESYGPLLFRVAHSVLRSRSEAEDAVQDAFVRVLQHRAKLPAVRDLRAWLVRIAWNLALDRKRRGRPEQLEPECAASLLAGSLPADQALQETRRMALLVAEIDKLPRLERQVLLLSAMDELSGAEIAQVVEKSDSAYGLCCFARAAVCANAWSSWNAGKEDHDERSQPRVAGPAVARVRLRGARCRVRAASARGSRGTGCGAAAASSGPACLGMRAGGGHRCRAGCCRAASPARAARGAGSDGAHSTSAACGANFRRESRGERVRTTGPAARRTHRTPQPRFAGAGELSCAA